jgi:hypothetical protein
MKEVPDGGPAYSSDMRGGYAHGVSRREWHAAHAPEPSESDVQSFIDGYVKATGTLLQYDDVVIILHYRRADAMIAYCDREKKP